MRADQKTQEGIDRRALFADGTADYRKPEEPDAGSLVELRFRTAKGNADRVYYRESGSGEGICMEPAGCDGRFDYYRHILLLGAEPVTYWFEIVKGQERCFYGRKGPADSEPGQPERFCITPGFHTPDWMKGAVIYQIFVDRFCNGDPSNDVLTGEYVYLGRPVRREERWGALPELLDVGHFYGGDLQGVRDKLDYLQYLGIEVIYFNPLFVSPSNHKYDTQDYDHIDPHYGRIVRDRGRLVPPRARGNSSATRYICRSTDPENLEASDAFFAEFVAEVHRRGMRVIMDGVFNHCGSFHKWLDREAFYKRQGGYEPGAYETKESPFHSYFRFPGGSWPNNREYESWWGNETLPKLNYEGSRELTERILEIGKKWVSEPFCADGWRLDVAADLGHSPQFNHRFWKRFRRAVKEANPEAVILAEHYGDASAWLQGDEWDTVMNYDAFMEPLSWFLTGMEKHSDEFRAWLLNDGEKFFASMREQMCRLQTPSLMTAMNQLSNHDHSRFLTRTNRTPGRIASAGCAKAEEGVSLAVLREAVMVQLTWPGAPALYYGDEAGLCGWTDPDNRRTYPWGRENTELIEYHKYMIALHRHIPALRRGSVKELACGDGLIAYGRMCGESRCVVAVNNSAEPRIVELPVWETGAADGAEWFRVMLTEQNGYNAGRCLCPVQDGILRLELPAVSGVLLHDGAI